MRSTCRNAATYFTAVALATGLAIAQAQPQLFPSHPVRVVVPFPAGGTLDGPARLVAETLSRLSGQQFVVENKAGAGGTVGAGEVARAPADGYTLLISSSAVPISQVLYKSVPFDSVKSYRVVAMFAEMPSVIAVNQQRLPVRTLAELIAHAKAHPGKLNYGSPGSGTGAHFAAEMFKEQAGIDIQHIPYRGAAPAVTDALGGQIDMVIAGQSSVAQQVVAGKLRALAVTTLKRSAQLPDVPTADEVVKGYESTTWLGLAAPARVPEPVMSRLAELVRQALKDEELRRKLVDAGVTPIFKGESEATAQIGREVATYGALARKANIQAE